MGGGRREGEEEVEGKGVMRVGEGGRGREG